MKNRILICILFCILSGCEMLKYEDDLTYLSPGKANYPSYFVLINGKPCQNDNGEMGFCYVRVPQDKNLNVKILPQFYTYTLDFRCGDREGIFFREKVDVMKDTEHMFHVEHSDFENKSVFNCLGDIFPKDREEGVSNFFEVRVRPYDKSYIEPSSVYEVGKRGKKYLVLGSNAHNAKVITDKGTYYLSKQTVFKFKSRVKFAMTETKNMRRSYYGRYED